MSETEIWVNQKRINGRLCQVDWRLIRALEEVSSALKALGTPPANLQTLDGLIEEAERISATVAIPDPPGCDPLDRTSLGG
jgi:hypothetical protein